MNNQQAFEGMITGMRRQGWRQSEGLLKGHVTCLYKGAGGRLKCAVGHLIPDNEYRTHFEGETILGIRCRVPALAGVSVSLLRQMQLIHDDELKLIDAGGEIDLVESLDNIAIEYRLHFDPKWILEEPQLEVKIEIALEEVEHAL